MLDSNGGKSEGFLLCVGDEADRECDCINCARDIWSLCLGIGHEYEFFCFSYLKQILT